MKVKDIRETLKRFNEDDDITFGIHGEMYIKKTKFSIMIAKKFKENKKPSKLLKEFRKRFKI